MRPEHDPSTTMPRELSIPLATLGGIVALALVTHSFGLGWAVALILAIGWWLDRSRPPAALPRVVVVPTADGERHAPPPWTVFRAASMATHGRWWPLVAQVEYVGRWIHHTWRRWATLRIATLVAVAWLLIAIGGHDARTAPTESIRAAHLLIATPGDTRDGSERRRALTELIENDAGLDGVALRGWDLTGPTRWSGFAKRRLCRAELTDSTLDLADARASDLRHSNLTNSRWIGADLHSARLDACVATGANFALAKLCDASLRNATLRTTSFAGGDLSGADLTGAVLSDAVFHDCDLTDAKLVGARWEAGRAPRGGRIAARTTRELVDHNDVSWLVVVD